MNLFQPLETPNSQRTMLAYRVRYWPWSELSPTGRSHVVFKANKYFYLSKSKILASINEDKTHLSWDGIKYPIVWAWNNVPTELEWNKKSANYLIKIELRYSPLLPDGNVAILAFELPSLNLNN